MATWQACVSTFFGKEIQTQLKPRWVKLVTLNSGWFHVKNHGGMGQICHAMSRQNRGAIRTRSQRLIPTQHLRISGYTYGQIT